MRLCKDLFGGLGVDQDVQHRRNDDPGNGMGHDIGDGEGGDLTLVEIALLHIQLLANRPTTTPVKAEAMTQLHHGCRPRTGR